jgi:hypothetical protein
VIKPLVRSKVIAQQSANNTATGSVRAFIVGVDGRLLINVALAHFPAANVARPSSFGSNAFSIYSWIRNQDGARARLSDIPVNGASGQLAPDSWEGQTNHPELELVLAYVGLGANTGRWEIVLTAAPGDNALCEADFNALAAALDVQVTPVTIA